jgi:type IV secretory pathway VirB4 component
MTEWNTLRARFPDDEFEEIERIKEQYGLSYNEIIRSGVKFYVGLTLAKELVGDALEEKDITIGGRNLGEILNSPDYQKNLEQKISKLVKILIWEFFEKGMDFKEKTKNIRKERKVGRPKTEKKVGRPKQGLD